MPDFMPSLLPCVLFSILTGCSPSEPTMTTQDNSSNQNSTSAPATVESHAQTQAQTTSESAAVKANPCGISEAEVDRQIAAINNTSTINALKDVIATLKACVPEADNAAQLKWLNASLPMYERLWAPDSTLTTEQQLASYDEFSHFYMPCLFEDSVDESLFQKMSARDQYIYEHLNEAYLNVQYVGEGFVEYQLDTQYPLDIFVPYLPEAQAVFITRMAQDNKEVFYNDAAITVSFENLVERAIFWEDYLKTYPNSTFKTEAQALFDHYRYALFFGSDNTQWTDDDAMTKMYSEEAYHQLQTLAKRPNSELADNARHYLRFLAMPLEQRQDNFPTSDVDENGYQKWAGQLAREQLQQQLPIPLPWESSNLDCLSSIVCTELPTQ